MQGDNISSSASQTHSTWRVGNPLDQNPCKIIDQTQNQGDLGSDEDWQCTMGSNSDVDDQEKSKSPQIVPTEHQTTPQHKYEPRFSEDGTHPYSTSQDTFVAPKAATYSSTQSSMSDFHFSAQPQPQNPVSASRFHPKQYAHNPHSDTVNMATPSQSDNETHMLDEQISIIPNYRGVIPSSPSLPDRPKPKPPSSADRLNSPVHQLHRVESDPIVKSTLEAETMAPRAATLPSRTPSDLSDSPPKHNTKTVSFVTNALASPKSSSDVDPKAGYFSDARQSNEDSSRLTNLEVTPALHNHSHKRAGILRAPNTNAKSSLAQSRFSATMRNLLKASSSDKNSSAHSSSSFSTSQSNVPTSDSQVSISHGARPSGSSPALRNNLPSNGPYEIWQDGGPNAQLGPRGIRPCAKQHGSQDAVDSGAVQGMDNIFSGYATVTVPEANYSKKRNSHPAPTPTTKTLSFLECVLELLKGTTVLKRRSFMHHPQVYLWLSADLCEIRYRITKKGNVSVTEAVSLSAVSKLKGSDREVSLEFTDDRKRVDFMFPSKGRADVWLSGLCCLVPAYASVISRHQLVSLRENYDPLTDSWNGKRLELRKRLRHYILLGTIGRGSFGKVKLALSTQNRQFYAVKVLSKTMMHKRVRSVPVNGVYRSSREISDLVAEDVNEIKIMAGLVHENVTRLVGVYNDTREERFYIVLEFVARGPIMSSAKLKGAEPLREHRARTAFVDVLAGIEYLHHMGVAHRDIKPDNLLEAGDGTVKISDFGAAVECNHTPGAVPSADHVTAGTPAFTAPEVAISDSSPKQEVNLFGSDMWSLGATLYYMIYGRAPFLARSVFEMYHAICKEELLFPDKSESQADLRALISSLMQKSPEKRATIDDVLRSPWLTKSVTDAKKLMKIRNSLQEHRGTAVPSRRESNPGPPRRSIPDLGISIISRVGHKFATS